MAQIKKGNPHGLVYAQVALMGTNGRSYGVAGSSQSVNTISAAYLIKDPLSGELPIPDRTTIDFTGGDKWLGAYQYGITSLGSFTLATAALDATLIALVTGSNVDQVTNQLWTIYSEDILRERLPQVCVLLTFRLQSRETGTDGGDYYITYIIPRAWMAPKGTSGAPGFQSKGQYSFQITPTTGDKFPHGLAFGTNQNWQDNKAPIFAIISDNPIALADYVGNGVATSFILPYKPLSTDVDSDNGRNQMVKNGTLTDLSAVNTGTAQITLAAAGASGDYHGMLYETNFIAP